MEADVEAERRVDGEHRVRVGVVGREVPAVQVVDEAVAVVVDAVAGNLPGVGPDVGRQVGMAQVDAGVDDADDDVGVAGLEVPGVARPHAGRGRAQVPLRGEHRVVGREREVEHQVRRGGAGDAGGDERAAGGLEVGVGHAGRGAQHARAAVGGEAARLAQPMRGQRATRGFGRQLLPGSEQDDEFAGDTIAGGGGQGEERQAQHRARQGTLHHDLLWTIPRVPPGAENDKSEAPDGPASSRGAAGARERKGGAGQLRPTPPLARSVVVRSTAASRAAPSAPRTARARRCSRAWSPRPGGRSRRPRCPAP